MRSGPGKGAPKHGPLAQRSHEPTHALEPRSSTDSHGRRCDSLPRSSTSLRHIVLPRLESPVPFRPEGPNSPETCHARVSIPSRPQCLRGILAYASVALDQNDFAGAEHQYRSAAASYPESLSVRYALGLFFVHGEKYEEAFAVFDSILAARPDELNARYQIGRTGALSGMRLDRAEQAMKEFLAAPPHENTPRPAGAHWRLGMIYEQQGRKDLAAEEYEKALAIDPGFADAKKSLPKLK